jgi:hypothetical protein
MSLSTIYSKTGKGAQVLTGKNKALPADSMRVLSQIDGKSSAESILTELGKFTEQEFTQILTRLLEGGHIRIVADEIMQDFFPDSDIAASIDVMEISAEEFLKTEASAHGLDSETKVRQLKEAEARAKAHAEEQLKLEAAARAQEESERELLEMANLLGNSAEEHINKDILAEQKARDEAIARAKAEAEKIAQSIAAEKSAAARQEAERKVREESAAQSQPHTDDSSRLETERVARIAESEEKARIAAEREATEKARQEAAAIARREAEEGARIAAELKAQEEAERVARKKAEAEEKARRESEEKTRIAAEREATEKARQEAAAIARREAEEGARIAAELKAREEAERVARKKAEAEEKARREVEEKARIAAEREAAEKARGEAAAIARREAEERARIAAELKAQEEAEAKARAREEAKHDAEARALIKAEEKARKRAEREPIDISKWIYGTIRVGRNLLITLSVSVLVLLLLLQLVNLGMLVSPLAGPVEKLLSENINEPVTIKKVYASLWPKPHLVLDDIAIGGSADIKIESIHVLPGLTTLFDKTRRLTYIKVSGFNITQDNFHRPVQWLSAAAKQGSLKFDQILLEKTTISLPGLDLPAFDGELNFAAGSALQNAILSTNNRKTVLQITPRDGAFAIDLTADEWKLPIGVPVVFDELHATGRIDHSQLELDQIKGRLYGGNIKAAMAVDWAAGWAATGNFKLSEVDLEKLMPVFSSQASMDGPVTSNAAFSLQADDFAKLLDNPEISADFSVDGGSINNIDLGRAMRASDKNAIGGSTRFNTLTGKLTLQNGNYKFRQLALKAGQLNASGEVDILANQDLAGAVNIGLATKSRQLQSHLNLAGKVGSPSLK